MANMVNKADRVRGRSSAPDAPSLAVAPESIANVESVLISQIAAGAKGASATGQRPQSPTLTPGEPREISGSVPADPERLMAEGTPVGRVERRRTRADRGGGARREAERSALARQLHDGIGQPMTSLLMEVDRAREDGEVAIDLLDRIERLARAALRNARRVVLEISGTDDARGPLEAARNYSESTFALAGCELVWEAAPDLHDLPKETARGLAAVIRESVTNIARHAAAQTVHVRIAHKGDAVTVTVEDDGVGLAPPVAGAPRDPGYGLRANRELAEALGGSFTVQPRFGGGTVVRFDAVIAGDD